MNNVIKFTMAAGVLALMGCTDNNVSGAAIEGNAVAQNSSSSDGASNSSSSSAENVKVDIDFSSKVTSSVALKRISISVYGEEIHWRLFVHYVSCLCKIIVFVLLR